MTDLTSMQISAGVAAHSGAVPSVAVHSARKPCVRLKALLRRRGFRCFCRLFRRALQRSSFPRAVLPLPYRHGSAQSEVPAPAAIAPAPAPAFPFPRPEILKE